MIASSERTAIQTMLGEWIEQERIARGHRVVDAARACGVSEFTLMKVRGPRGFLSQRVRRALGSYLRLSPDSVALLSRVPVGASRRTFRRDSRTRHRMTFLGQALEAERKRRDQTMEEAATAMGIHVSTLLWLKTRSVRRVYRHTESRVARYLGISPELVLEWAERPAGSRFPIETFVGRKLHPTVRPYAPSRAIASCLDCVYVDGCREDVARGDFAWCEDVIPEDLVPGEPDPDYELEESYA